MGSKRKREDLPSLDTPSKIQRIVEESFEMDKDFSLRFPLLAESIFDCLDNQSLVKCKEISKEWNDFLRISKFLLVRKIQETMKSHHQFGALWENVGKKQSAGLLSVANYWSEILSFVKSPSGANGQTSECFIVHTADGQKVP